MVRLIACGTLLFAISAATLASAAPPDSQWVTAHALFGEPKYAPNFDHFNYVNPNAPKGGTLILGNPDRRTSFDKFNPYTVKGDAPAGVTLFMFETLAFSAPDEPETFYGLIGQYFQIAPDLSSLTVKIDPRARFYNGDPVTSEDVKYSYDCISSTLASPSFSSQFVGVSAVHVIDAQTVRFDFKDRTPDTLFALTTGLPIFSHKWGLKADGTHIPFDQMITEYPITTGPYTIELTDSGRRIVFALDEHYWARDLPVHRGFFNFARIVYRYYQDSDIQLEAFKAGEYDINVEMSARRWARYYSGAKFANGQIIRRSFPVGLSQGYQAYQMNLRRPLFSDIRVRDALNYSFDWSEVDRRTYHQYHRTNSAFSNSDYAATGMPSAAELALLEPYRSQLDSRVFGPAFTNPDAGERSVNLRNNLRHARDLLAAAGWKVAADGVLRNASGTPFQFEYLDPEAGGAAAVSSWQRNLAKLGIEMTIRQVDYALYNKRLEVYDFDMITIAGQASTLPVALVLEQQYGSKAADVPGASNSMGIKNPVLDALIKKIAAAQSYAELHEAAHAFDRVFMWGHYGVPDLYSGSDRAAYWNRFGIPDVLPDYYTIIQSPDSTSLMAWPLYTWWLKDPAARAAH
jgi:microcin C transport system substrate-binding protein